MLTEKVIVIDSDSKHLKPLRDEVGRFLSKASFSVKVREDILVALGEAVANSMRHAYKGESGHEIRVTIQEDPGKVIFKIRDFGEKIDLSKVEEQPKLPPEKPHGLGIYFMKTIMNEIKYNTDNPEGNELILTKYKDKGAHS